MKDKAISKKIDIAKVLTEIYHHNGDVGGALNDDSMKTYHSTSRILERWLMSLWLTKKRLKQLN